MSRTKQILITVLLTIFVTSPTFAEWKENARAIDISGGEDHTLVLTANKWAWGCGNNYYYQLGIGNNQDQKILVRVLKADMNSTSNYLENIDDVDAGWTHSLCLDVNGLVCAWGRNGEGQLGVGEGVTYSSIPAQVHGVDDEGYLDYIVAISAGRSGLHSLAVDANGYAYAWGYNKYGQCGNGEYDCNEWTPVYVHQGAQPNDPNDANECLKHIVDICAGSDQSIAVEKDDPGDPNFSGCVYTWGTNRWGDDPWDVGIVSLGCGLLGTASDVNLSDTPVKVFAGAQHPNDPNQPYLNHIVAVAAGWDHCMALEKDDPYDPNIYNPAYTGRVFTWGNNGPGWGGGDPCNLPEEVSVGGRLGNGTYTDSNVPVLVLSGAQHPNDPNQPYLNHIVVVSAGEGHSMALDAYGYVYTWGDNQYGQLGNGRNEPCSAPVRVVAGMQNPEDPNSPLSNIVAISTGHWHSLAIDANGVIWTWGKGSAGRLGLGNKTIDCNTPHPIPVVYNITQETFAFGIQTAIDDANEAGDTLEASPGTYFEDVDFLTKTITLRSADPNNTEVVESTVIKGSGSGYIPAVAFTDNLNSTLSGFTIANDDYGIKCDSSSPTISNSVIANCGGHGLYCLDNSGVEVKNCTISGNGGSINPVEDGINCSSSQIMLTNCLITGNAGNGIYEYNPAGAALIANSIIRGNGDDGIYSEGFSSGPKIRTNWIYDNGGSGIVTYNDDSVPAPVSNAVIVNNTIVNNNSNGVMSYYAVDAEITSSIIWNNGSNPSDNLHATNGAFSVAYSCIEGGYAGMGNINSDPCFVDDVNDDYHLTWESPCVDTGDPNFVEDANETDIDGENRVEDGDANGTAIVDMGADEFYWSPADLSGDGIVNFIDYAMLTSYWQDAGIDYNDVFLDGDSNSLGLAEFCDRWLWEGGFLSGSMPLMGGRGGAGMIEGLGLDAGLSAVAVAEREPAVAEPVDIESILKWLAEIWLDPEVRKSIDEEKFLKVYESLKGL